MQNLRFYTKNTSLIDFIIGQAKRHGYLDYTQFDRENIGICTYKHSSRGKRIITFVRGSAVDKGRIPDQGGVHIATDINEFLKNIESPILNPVKFQLNSELSAALIPSREGDKVQTIKVGCQNFNPLTIVALAEKIQNLNSGRESFN